MKILPHAAFRSVSLREVRPAGWVSTYLERQCQGLTGHIAASGYPFGLKFWGSLESETDNPYANWWPYEQTGYWIDGALKCGYLVEQPEVYHQALEEIEFAIEHASSDGYIGPESMRNKDRWSHAVFFRAVLAQAEISGEARYLEALTRHYRALPHPMAWDRDVTGVEILALLYQERGEVDLLQMAEALYSQFNQLFPEHDCSLQSLQSDKPVTEHGVTFNEIAKLAAILYSATGKSEYLEAARRGYAKIEENQILADGMHSCTEQLRGRDPLDSHETCDISDYTWALGYLLQATGEAHYADRIEQVIFNAAPGAVTKDFKALQYFSCPNQVIATENSNHNHFLRGFNWMMYRPDHEVQCCPGNLHRAMPNYVSRMWLRAPDGTPSGGIVAALYGPGSIQTTAGVGQIPLTITAETAYPFEQAINFIVQPERQVRFAFWLRLPSWCSRPTVSINDQPIRQTLTPGGFLQLERDWQPGDMVRLELPFTLRLEHWPGDGVSVAYGPLVFSMPVAARAVVETENSTLRQRRFVQGEFFTDRPYQPLDGYPALNLFPASPWNYALCVDEGNLAESAQIIWKPNTGYPFDCANPPIVLRLPARIVEGWNLKRTKKVKQFINRVIEGAWVVGERRYPGDFLMTPPLPDPATLPERLSQGMARIDLVPYGCTLLRMTVFPQASINPVNDL